jgi:hypothetical protein
MFLPDGKKTEAVDVVHNLWKGEFPQNRSPRLDSLLINGNNAYTSVTLNPGSENKAVVYTSDPENDDLKIVWEILEETTDKRTGGDIEEKPPAVEDLIVELKDSIITFNAPLVKGPYRLFVFVYDQNGSGAHANIPFYVKNDEDKYGEN